MKTDEAANLLGLEPSRVRFLEKYCQDFLSQCRWEIPRKYDSHDLKVLATGSSLLDSGLSPSALKPQLARILTEPFFCDNGSNGVPDNGSRRAKLIAVASGKGGVGKSNIALNLGVEFAESGLRTIVMDADLGVANVHLLAGLKTGSTLKDVVSGTCAMTDVIAHLSGGPDIVPGSSGILELADLPGAKRQILLDELRKIELNYDVILVDTAAGVSRTVLDFVVSSDFALVVTTAETTAITDAYALIKLGLERNPLCRIGLVANRVRNAREGELALKRIAECVQRFLGRSVLELGCIWEDTHVRAAVNERVPLSIGYPRSRASVAVRKLAGLLRDEDIVSPRAALMREKTLSPS